MGLLEHTPGRPDARDVQMCASGTCHFRHIKKRASFGTLASIHVELPVIMSGRTRKLIAKQRKANANATRLGMLACPPPTVFPS
mmetsp:Transcript_32053/g.103433  ORF Transcript_32053/g.103433 Transcript_32053/m.103433 type:complete len:84 (-) Transcript_32053:1127-1378(-)